VDYNLSYGEICLRIGLLGNTSENGQELPEFKTVGYLSNRYRLGHWWVP